MATNHFFQEHHYSGEQEMVEDLVIEAIQIHGIDVYYVPRASATGLTDALYGEDILSKFISAYPIEMYIDRTDAFDATGELMTKFGMMMNNQVDFVVSIRRFGQLGTNLERPREGDLIYFRQKPALFEIKFVADKTEFYQLHKLFFYKLTTELFKYGQETIDTGIDEIDTIDREVSYRLAFNMGAGVGNYTVGEKVTQASASATVASWDAPSKVLTVIDIDGQFADNVNVVGALSGASYTLTSYDDLVDLDDDQNANKMIRDVANTTLDFSESNPFGDSQP